MQDPLIDDENDLTMEQFKFHLRHWEVWMSEMQTCLNSMDHSQFFHMLGNAAFDKTMRSFETNAFVRSGLEKGDPVRHFLNLGYVVYHNNNSQTLRYKGISNEMTKEIPLVKKGVICEIDVNEMDCPLFNALYRIFLTKKWQSIHKGQSTKWLNREKKRKREV